MATIFFTGFPGFLGKELLPRVLARRAGDRALCLVQARFLDQAEQARGELIAADRGLEGRIELVVGDIVAPDLGLGPKRDAIAKEVAEIYHLAAVYDLDVPRELAMRVNVHGTRHILDFAKRCEKLERHHYVSTCYVSGDFAGPFSEDDLDKGQGFSNFYEETKFLAELDVQAARDAGMPTTIYRPAVVVGDQRTGATQKFDGPYFIIKWMLRQPAVTLMPRAGSKGAVLNVVPRDYVVDAIAYLSGIKASVGKTYQLSDPNPPTVEVMLELLAAAADRKLITLPLSADLGAGLLRRMPPAVQSWFGVPAASLAYLSHSAHYICDKTTADLQGSGISCPRFDTYAEKMVTYVKAHPEVGSQAMT